MNTLPTNRPHTGQVLSRLYLLRAGFAALWVTLILGLNTSHAHHASGDLFVLLAISIYPAADAVASLIDVRAPNTPASRWLLYGNAVIGFLAATTILVLGAGPATEICAFGIWAIASSAAQLLVGALRQRTPREQWLMIVSGTGSVFAGATLAGLLGPTTRDLSALAQYSAGGAIFYLLAAGLLIGATHFSTPKPVPNGK